jgi:four helix bundle suffix protein
MNGHWSTRSRIGCACSTGYGMRHTIPLGREIENPDPVISANVIIGLIRVCSYLLDRQIRALEEAFVRDGGLRERMTRARVNERKRRN